jgi:hypothetical protein
MGQRPLTEQKEEAPTGGTAPLPANNVGSVQSRSIYRYGLVRDPASDYSREPQNNGKRINMGAYGNTAEASLTPVNGTLLLLR